MVKAYIITASVLVGLVLGGAAAWQTQNWRYGTSIAKMKKESAEEHSTALQSVIDESNRMEKQKNEAIEKAEGRAREYKVLAYRNSSSVASMRDKLKAAESRYSEASNEAIIRHASIISGIVESCTHEYQRLGIEATSLASDLEMISEAWPK